MLDKLFSDRTFRFTAPVDLSAPPVPPIFLNFDQLYLEALLSGTKTTGALRTKVRASVLVLPQRTDDGGGVEWGSGSDERASLTVGRNWVGCS